MRVWIFWNLVELWARLVAALLMVRPYEYAGSMVALASREAAREKFHEAFEESLVEIVRQHREGK